MNKPVKIEELIRDSEARGKAFAARILNDAKVKAMIHKRRGPLLKKEQEATVRVLKRA